MEQQWVRSSFCHQGGCVEVFNHEGVYLLRDSDAPDFTVSMNRDSWEQFILGVKAGEFDLL